MFLTEIGLDLIGGALGGRRGGGSLRPVTPLLVPYGKQKIAGYVHTLLSIDKGIDCVSGFVLSCIFEKRFCYW